MYDEHIFRHHPYRVIALTCSSSFARNEYPGTIHLFEVYRDVHGVTT